VRYKNVDLSWVQF